MVLTVLLFLLPIHAPGRPEQITYSQLKSDIAAGQVASVALGPDGSVSGQLTNGTEFTSSYPVDLQDPQFAQLLDQHDVRVSTQPARTSSWPVLLNFLPLLLLVGLFWWTGRATRRQLAGLTGLGRSRGPGLAGPRAKCSTWNGHAPCSRTWPGTRAPSGRSARWSTS